MEPRSGVADVSAAGQQYAVTYSGVALGCDHGNEAAQRVSNDHVLFGGEELRGADQRVGAFVDRQAEVSERQGGEPREERQGIVVVEHRDSNHPEACGQENRFNFRLRPKRTPKPMDIEEVHSIECAFTRVVSFDQLLDRFYDLTVLHREARASRL